MTLCMRRLFAVLALACVPCVTLAQDAGVPPEVTRLVEKFNDEAIPFNDNLLVLGKADAPVTAVLVFGLSGNGAYLVKRAIAEIIDKYVDTGKLKLVVIEMPLTWHDMQAFAGFRCVAPEKHWDVLKRALLYPRDVMNMKNASLEGAPDYIWPMMKGFDVSREQAEKCMRNTAIVGLIEGQRRVVQETWNTGTAPTFIVGDQVFVDPQNDNLILTAIAAAVKGEQ